MLPSTENKENKWSIGTYLRIKPLFQDENNRINYDIQEHALDDGSKRSSIELEIPMDADPGLVHNNSASGSLRYEYDRIFSPQTTQDEVFQSVAKEKVIDALDGINCTVFAYGQTGSGKTYSIFGGESYKDRGIIPRAISTLFQEVQRRKQQHPSYAFKCQVTFTEIYKETVYDLLNTDKRTVQNQTSSHATTLENFPVVSIYESEDGIVLKNLNVFDVNTEEDALQLFFLGNANRITASTSMNQVSSRSHAIFTLVFQSEVVQDNRMVYTTGKINFVDLAGSERMYKMANSKEAIVEAKAINLSLHYLEQVIVTLREQNKRMTAPPHASSANNPVATTNASNRSNEETVNTSTTSNQSIASSSHDTHSTHTLPRSISAATHSPVVPPTAPSTSHNQPKEKEKEKEKEKTYYIPYRNSVLTNLLRDSLGGNCRSSFLLTVSPEKYHFEESVATCRFGQRCGEIKLIVQANTEIGLSDQLKDLQGKVKSLERKVSSLEDKKHTLESLLTEEQDKRVFQTAMRDITEEEKLRCKGCVQELLTAAKDSLFLSITSAVSNNSTGIPTSPSMNGLQGSSVSGLTGTPRRSGSISAGAFPVQFTEAIKKQIRASTEQLTITSQDHLYNTVEQMDKAVLVELTTALGGLIQSMYIDRELMKHEETQAKKQLVQGEEEKEKVIRDEKVAWQLLAHGDAMQLTQQWGRTLPPMITKALINGSFFIKHSRHGVKTVRMVSISPDCTALVWKGVLPVANTPYAPHAHAPSAPSNEAVVIPLQYFDGVEYETRPTSTIGGAPPTVNAALSPIHLIVLKGKEGLTKSIILEYVDAPCNACYPLLQAKEWIAAFRFLIQING